MTFPLIASALSMMAIQDAAPELTIYNQGFALIKQNRRIDLAAGVQEIAIEDVSAMIDSTSVGFKGRGISVLEQNYQYDLISSQAILNKAVGQRVRFVRTLGTQRDVLEGTLLSSPTAIVSRNGSSEQTYNGMVIRADDGRIVLDPTGEVEVTKLPQGLISRPTLLWTVDAPTAGAYPVDLSYISGGFSWSADYVLTLDGAGHGDLQGWATVNNQCGTRFEHAKLKLLAGDVNVVRDESVELAMKPMRRATPAVVGALKEESLFEYHLYTLERPTTLENRETKQLALLEGHGINARTRLAIAFDSGAVDSGDQKPSAFVEFKNSIENHLGLPMPKGRVRVFQRDKSGSVQMLGENSIDHTPRDERISLAVGKSFDVVAHAKQKNYSKIDNHRSRVSGIVELRNRKAIEATIDVDLQTDGSWKLIRSSAASTKTDASTLRFHVVVPAGKTTTFDYTIETRY